MMDHLQIVTEHPTVEELMRRLIEFAPRFADAWKESVFRDKNHASTVHVVFAAFSWYIRGNLGEMEEQTRVDLFAFVEECVKTNPKSRSGISNAACTCFLENIAGERNVSRAIAKYLGPESRKYFVQWN